MSKLKNVIFVYVAFTVILVSFFVLVGWVLDVPFLQTIFPTLVTMKFNTALCFLLTGVSLLFHNNAKYNSVTSLLLFFVFSIIVLTLFEYFFSINLGIDQFFVNDLKNPVKNAAPGRMSSQTAILFLILTIVLFFIRFRRSHRFIELALFFAILNSVAGFLGFAFHTNEANYIPTFSQISLITVSLFFLLCVAVFYSPLISYRKFTFQKKINLGVGVIVVCFFILSYVFNETRINSIKSHNEMQKAEDVIVEAETVLSLIRDLQLITVQSVLARNNFDSAQESNSSSKILKSIDKLKTNKNFSSSNTDSFQELEVLVHKELAFLRQVSMLQKLKRFEEARTLLFSKESNERRFSIEEIVRKIQSDENKLIAEQEFYSKEKILHSDKLILFFEILIIVSLVISYFIILRNFNEKQEVQKLLEKSNKRFFRIFNYNPVAMAITTVSDGKFVFVNDFYSEITGYKREDLIGKTSYELNIIGRQERLKLVAIIKENGGSHKDLEVKINKANGEKMIILLSVQSLYIDEQDCFIYALIDITERIRIKEKLEEVNAELDSFTYSVSHDLRAPLRAISGYTKILNEDYGKAFDEDGKHFMDVIAKNAIKMGQLIDDLLSFSRLGRQHITHVPIDMINLVQSILEDVKVYSNSKPIDVEFKDLLVIKGDISMIKIVMSNLLSNAVKYSSKQEKIQIEVGSYYREDNIVYYVKDNGVGFDMQYSSKLFGVFQRLHSVSEFEGTGVGLAIVNRIIKKHGGNVWAESFPNSGSVFYFELPNHH